ncbi:hypothetical protein B0J18DRAFT_374815 [Chaetomium sp. MPI-SDFR-AT-0129]|nr:hypothetical protein B0J18DRAFT_374815 [Chaetomium sp. MPI-SDFR-AT-0129]
MDGRNYSLGSSPHNTTVPPPLPERPARPPTLPPLSEVPSPRPVERASASALRSAFRQTVRAVTPEPVDPLFDSQDGPGSDAPRGPRGIGSASPQTSPRSIPLGAAGLPARRQGIVFHDSFPGSLDGPSTSPPLRATPFRPRTHTMDGAFRQQLGPALETRNRMGSFSSATSLSTTDDVKLPPFASSFESYHHPDFQQQSATPSSKDKKPCGPRSRLSKRSSSRPSSPLSSLPPSVDSLPLPIPTTDVNKILLLMKNLCGRMRGEVEYQKDFSAPWVGGLCYIEEERGSLMFDPGDSGPFHTPLISDLRGCRVAPVDSLDRDSPCLEVSSAQLGTPLFLRPLVPEELDLWLAALLCWQQLRPSGAKPQPVRSAGNPSAPAPARMEMKRRVSLPGLRETAIIKVGKLMLWDKGVAMSPRAIVRRPSTRDLRSAHTCWRKVSCILHDNGELKIMTENDVTVLSVIELSQLARSAIQQLDKSVLDEEYCLAIFPSYSSTSTQLSIFRPVYLALETRVLFEVWFVLLRAFTIPDVYNLDLAGDGRVCEVTDFQHDLAGETFRVEKTISVRITEAKLRSRTWGPEAGQGERPGDRHGDRVGKGGEPDPLTGNYLAEVILDGEVRARTTTKMETKNPFWREDYIFMDLPASLPFLSILLKKVDGNVDSFAHHLQATFGMGKSTSVTETPFGFVDIPLHHLECGKDYEQWLQIHDDRQQPIGSMLVKIHHEEFVVLLLQNYQPLSELLHRFSSGLIAQIVGALPGSLRRLSEIFVNIFQVSGCASEWLMNMVEEEIDGIGNQAPTKKGRFSGRLKSNDSIESNVEREQVVRDLGKSLQGEANLLFRGNSLLTQALEFHMRRLGNEYLSETLAEKILEINESDCSCEVDPSKLQPGEDIQQHWTHLLQFTNDIWDCIASSTSRLPPELRHILKYIRAVAEDRYGDFLRTVTYTSVSGFLFLRFLCPAILNPKLFGLSRDHPQPRAQRTFTLIAKSLQALANLSSIGKKETWMEPMNRFLTAQRQPFKDFLDDVCAIPAERTKGLLPPSYSTPTTIMGRLSPMAREGFPSLPYLIDQGRYFAALVKLWSDAHSTSARESQVYDGDLLTFHTLCISLHQRALDCLARIEALRAVDSGSLPSDDQATLVDTMDRFSITDMLGHPTSAGGNTAAWLEHDVRAPGSSGSDLDVPGGLPFGTISISRDARHGSFSSRELGPSSLRQMSRNTETAPSLQSQESNPSIGSGNGNGGSNGNSGNGGSGNGGSTGTVRSLRTGIHPRRLLGGLMMRKTRNTSPEISAAPGLLFMSGHIDREREGDREKEKDRERERDKDRGRDKRPAGLPEPRQVETVARAHSHQQKQQ